MSDQQIPTTSPSPADDVPAVPPRALQWLPPWELVALFVGDFIALIVFGVWGQSSHGLLASSASPIAAVINTAAPFMLSWLIIAIVTGTYQAKALYPLPRVIWKTALAGLIAGPFGGMLWALSRNRLGDLPAPIFFLITTLLTTSLMLVWRVLWSRLRLAWWPELR